MNDKTLDKAEKKLDKIEERKLELASLAGGELIEAMAYAASLLEHRAA